MCQPFRLEVTYAGDLKPTSQGEFDNHESALRSGTCILLENQRAVSFQIWQLANTYERHVSIVATTPATGLDIPPEV